MGNYLFLCQYNQGAKNILLFRYSVRAHPFFFPPPLPLLSFCLILPRWPVSIQTDEDPELIAMLQTQVLVSNNIPLSRVTSTYLVSPYRYPCDTSFIMPAAVLLRYIYMT